MSAAGALQALLNAYAGSTSVTEKDWEAAAGLIVKKLLISAGQTVESIRALKAAVGDDIFETQLKSLTPYQARLLARRLNKSVPDLDVSTARAAVAHVRGLLAATIVPGVEAEAEPVANTAEETPVETETASSGEPEAAPESPSPPPAANPYFGRRSFRT